MSSTNKTANYQLSQFVGTDIPSILNDYNGDMRKIDTAIKEVATAEGSSAADIAGLQATVGQHTTEIGGLSSTVNSLSGRVIGIEGKIPANASEQNKLITAEDIPEIPSIDELTNRVEGCENDIDSIESKIPANASASNKLVTQADIPDIPSIDELTQRVETCETDVNACMERVVDCESSISVINSKIPANASVSNKLATMADIGSASGGIVKLGEVTGTSYSSFDDIFNAIKAILDDAIDSGNYMQYKLILSQVDIGTNIPCDGIEVSSNTADNIMHFSGDIAMPKNLGTSTNPRIVDITARVMVYFNYGSLGSGIRVLEGYYDENHAPEYSVENADYEAVRNCWITILGVPEMR